MEFANRNKESDGSDKLIGELHLVMGPMYAGKSSHLIKKYKELAENEKSREEGVLVVTHSIENRYSVDKLSSHDREEIGCSKFSDVQTIIDSCNSESELANIRHILIDESQFFPDLMKVLTLVEENKKMVYVFGLDGDFKRNKFGSITDLIPICDTVQKLRGQCSECERPSLFSWRISNDKITQIVVGSEDKYVPLCRSCYMDKNEKVI